MSDLKARFVVMHHFCGSYEVKSLGIKSSMFVHENPLEEHRTVKQVFDSYLNRFEIANSCNVFDLKLHLKVDADDSSSYIIDNGELATSMSLIAFWFIGDHEERSEMVFIVSMFLEERNIPTNPLNFHLEFHVLLHVFDPSGENYQLKKKILRFDQGQELDETCDHKATPLINYCVSRTISTTLGSGIQRKLCLEAVKIIPRRDRLPETLRNSQNRPALNFQEELPTGSIEKSLLPEVTTLFQFIEALKADAASDKNVIILLNVVVVRNP